MPPPDGAIAWKNANALFPDAVASGRVFLAKGIGGPFGLSRIIERFRTNQGGLWVGGTVYLMRDCLSFEPNVLNVKAHANNVSRRVALQSIDRIEARPGYVTQIVELALKDGSTFAFRCFGARAFAQRIQAALKDARPG